MKANGALPFLKVEGAGNDFVLIDARQAPLARPNARQIRALLDRHRGVGGDGLLWLESSEDGPRVRYWNADGGRAAYCGNGARCVARVLLTGTRQREVEFRFGRMQLRARGGEGNRIAIRTPTPKLLPLPRRLPPMPRGVAPTWIDAGVPHWILPVDEVDVVDLERIAPAIRGWKPLGPGGTNVDLVGWRGRELCVRTFERGVEGETLACGSGLLAAAFWAAAFSAGSFGTGAADSRAREVTLRSRGGDRFRVRRDEDPRHLWLEGPAAIVFRGSGAIAMLPPRKASGAPRASR